MSVRGRVQSNDDDHRATTFELFFDLVFVFAFTQLTSYMAHNHTAAGIVQAMLLLALFWWSWSAYAWLGNQANAGVGTVRAVMVVAMTAVFIGSRVRAHPRVHPVDGEGGSRFSKARADQRRSAPNPLARHSPFMVASSTSPTFFR